MAKAEESIFENIVMAIDDAIDTEVGEKREYSEATDMKLDEIQTMLKEALGLPEDYTL